MSRRKRQHRRGPPAQLTLRGLEPELERRLRRLAAEENLSLNQAALKLLNRGAGLAERRVRLDTVGDAFDDFIGSWSAARAQQVADAVSDFERIDDEMWS